MFDIFGHPRAGATAGREGEERYRWTMLLGGGRDTKEEWEETIVDMCCLLRLTF